MRALCRDKNVIHVGYVAHKENIDEHIRRGIWLHKHLLDWSKRCTGIDIDCEGVKILAEKYNITDAVCADIEKDYIADVDNNEWDILLLGEVLEHVNNPVHFLSSIKKHTTIKRIIITVPNLLYYGTYKEMLRYQECINSDHRYSFTPYNLCKVVSAAGLHIEDLSFCGLTDNLPRLMKYKRSLYKRCGKTLRYPYYFFKGLILSATLAEVSEPLRFADLYPFM